MPSVRENDLNHVRDRWTGCINAGFMHENISCFNFAGEEKHQWTAAVFYIRSNMSVSFLSYSLSLNVDVCFDSLACVGQEAVIMS